MAEGGFKAIKYAVKGLVVAGEMYRLPALSRNLHNMNPLGNMFFLDTHTRIIESNKDTIKGFFEKKIKDGVVGNKGSKINEMIRFLFDIYLKTIGCNKYLSGAILGMGSKDLALKTNLKFKHFFYHYVIYFAYKDGSDTKIGFYSVSKKKLYFPEDSPPEFDYLEKINNFSSLFTKCDHAGKESPSGNFVRLSSEILTKTNYAKFNQLRRSLMSLERNKKVISEKGFRTYNNVRKSLIMINFEKLGQILQFYFHGPTYIHLYKHIRPELFDLSMIGNQYFYKVHRYFYSKLGPFKFLSADKRELIKSANKIKSKSDEYKKNLQTFKDTVSLDSTATDDNEENVDPDNKIDDEGNEIFGGELYYLPANIKKFLNTTLKNEISDDQIDIHEEYKVLEGNKDYQSQLEDVCNHYDELGELKEAPVKDPVKDPVKAPVEGETLSQLLDKDLNKQLSTLIQPQFSNEPIDHLLYRDSIDEIITENDSTRKLLQDRNTSELSYLKKQYFLDVYMLTNNDMIEDTKYNKRRTFSLVGGAGPYSLFQNKRREFLESHFQEMYEISVVDLEMAYGKLIEDGKDAGLFNKEEEDRKIGTQKDYLGLLKYIGEKILKYENGEYSKEVIPLEYPREFPEAEKINEYVNKAKHYNVINKYYIQSMSNVNLNVLNPLVGLVSLKNATIGNRCRGGSIHRMKIGKKGIKRGSTRLGGGGLCENQIKSKKNIHLGGKIDKNSRKYKKNISHKKKINLTSTNKNNKIRTQKNKSNISNRISKINKLKTKKKENYRNI